MSYMSQKSNNILKSEFRCENESKINNFNKTFNQKFLKTIETRRKNDEVLNLIQFFSLSFLHHIPKSHIKSFKFDFFL